MVVAGNHDSPVLLETLDFAVTAFGADPGPGGAPRLKFVTRARRPRDGGILDYPARGGEQRIRVAALPFIHQNRFLDEFTSPATATRDYARHLREIQAELQRGLLDGYQPARTSSSSPRTCTCRAPSPPTPSGPSRSATPT